MERLKFMNDIRKMAVPYTEDYVMPVDLGRT